MLEEMNAFYTPWSVLQQPYHSSSGINAGFRSLLAALDLGWKIENPVQLLPLTWTRKQTYRFILTHPTTMHECVIHVPRVPEVEETIDQYDYAVVVVTTA